LDNAIRLLTQIGGGAAFNGNQVCGDIRIGIPCTCRSYGYFGIGAYVQVDISIPGCFGSIAAVACCQKKEK
jgi:hypothetical protein